MSKLPERNPQSGFIRPKENVGYIVAYDDGQERNLISAHGFHLESSDFSDLYLPALQFIDDVGKTHFISIATDGTLLVDNNSVVNLNDYYTKQETDGAFSLFRDHIEDDFAKSDSVYSKTDVDKNFYKKQDVYTKKESDARQLLVAPNKTKYLLTVDNSGKLGTKKV
ncbi:hypothetical protein JK159_03850 [Weissella minor]|uniref:hypothetical protein n=1 Tax=Weissella minor TaxID=1620 RepID=UPI001BB0985C|nr:hypothetical protein [Weissella minor]MBS0949512.1 hypothetical protein [Weissella minor]